MAAKKKQKKSGRHGTTRTITRTETVDDATGRHVRKHVTKIDHNKVHRAKRTDKLVGEPMPKIPPGFPKDESGIIARFGTDPFTGETTREI